MKMINILALLLSINIMAAQPKFSYHEKVMIDKKSSNPDYAFYKIFDKVGRIIKYSYHNDSNYPCPYTYTVNYPDIDVPNFEVCEEDLIKVGK